MIYEGQLPAIKTDIDDLFRLLAEIVDLSKSGRCKFRSEVNRGVFIPL
jgi:hypothetical protein